MSNEPTYTAREIASWIVNSHEGLYQEGVPESPAVVAMAIAQTLVVLPEATIRTFISDETREETLAKAAKLPEWFAPVEPEP
jgi:hypothetical protein